eukprot:TRINITY_DN15029_c0_g5_i2.p1 TRINITY_DN15029_c0_g5~~TRINITY_DN15029_c0_g5_i2.p1  ORF type:complete len:177 (-),score=28.33 TRINITY_DN15029_c0_g5_i2:190-720(-)
MLSFASRATQPGLLLSSIQRSCSEVLTLRQKISLSPHLSPNLRSTSLGAAHSGGMAQAMSTDVQSIGGATPAVVAYITINNKDEAKKLATSIVENKLAACVNIVPGIESTYWWEGKVSTDAEVLLIVKTRQSLVDSLTRHVEANHPYDLPEVIALPIVAGNSKYLKWIEESTDKET